MFLAPLLNAGLDLSIRQENGLRRRKARPFTYSRPALRRRKVQMLVLGGEAIMSGQGIIASVVCLGLLFFAGGAGLAADPVALVTAQLKTAIFHAGQLAVRGARTGTPGGPELTAPVLATREHLQHVINCIEGPGGKDFKTASGYPCQGQGNGILVDLKTAQTAGVGGAARATIFVNAALHVAMRAVGSADVNESQPFAAVVARNLQLALDAVTR